MSKNMTTLEYMKRKNEILKKMTGKELIPEDQMVEVDAYPLGMTDTLTGIDSASDGSICPYCIVYTDGECDSDDSDSCTLCPMKEAGNWCNEEEGPLPTYKIVSNLLISIHRDGMFMEVPEIKELVNEFNSQFYDISDEGILNSHDVIAEVCECYPPNVIKINGDVVEYYHGLEEGLMCWDAIDKNSLVEHIKRISMRDYETEEDA